MIFFFRNSLQGLWFNKVRSFLTGAGVFVGVTSVVLIMALSAGLLTHLRSDRLTSCDIALMSSAEANLDVVSSLSDPAIQGKLSAIAQRSDVASFAPVRSSEMVSVHLVSGEDVGVLVTEFDDNVAVIEGNSFREVPGNVAIMFRNPEFRDITVGSQIVIDSETFSVIGLTNSLGAAGSTRLYLPLRMKGTIQVSGAAATATYRLTVLAPRDFAGVRSSVLNALNAGIDPNLKFIDMTAEMDSALQSVLSSVQAILGLIASISLIVAAINIVNTMYIATLERADEIAVLKSLGMSRIRVLLLFVLESVIVVAVFAVLGCLMGNLGAWVILYIFGYRMVFSWLTPAVILPVTLVVGLGGGLYPAQKAAKIDPARLLR